MANELTSGGMNLKVGITYSEEQARRQLTTVLNKLENKSTLQIPVTIDGERFVKTVRTYQDQMKNLIEVTTLYNGAGKTFQDTITKITTSTERAENEINRLSQSQQKLNQTTKQGINIFQDFANTFLKMAKFNTINLIYDAFTDSVTNAVTVVEEFNRATTELRKVSDLEGESLKAYTKELAKYGEEVGRTMTDMVNSATIFKRTGATDEEAIKLAQIAEMYRNIADNEISSAEASSFLVSQMKAFNITADQSIRIIDAVNEVANRHAVSTNDLQIALSKASASLATANNSYEETIALVEGATAIMQGQAGTVGNGLRTLAINVASLATESENFVSASGKVNIALKDEQGQLRSTYSILNDLSQVWGDLSSSEQMAVAKELGGKTRFNVITSLMRNFADAQQSLADALGSTGSAIQENERYMESISAKQAKWASEVQQFVLGDGGLEAFEKKLLDIGVATMQFINNIGGLQTILTTLGTILTMALVPTITTLITSIGSMIGSIGVLATNFITARQAGYTFSMALNEIGVSGITAQTALQGLVGVIGLAIIAFNAYRQSQERAKQIAYDASQEALNQVNTIQQQIDKLNQENLSRENLLKAIQAVDNAYKDEGQGLDKLNKKRQETIKQLKEEQQAQLENAKNTGWSQFLTDKSILGGDYTSLTSLTGTGITRNMITGYEQQAKAYGVKFNSDSLKDYVASLNRLQDYAQTTGTRIEGLSKDIAHAQEVLAEATQGVTQYEQILSALNIKYDENTGCLIKMTEAEIKQKEAQEQADSQMQNTLDMFDKLGVSVDEVVEKLSEEDFSKLQELIMNDDIAGATALLESYGFELQNVGENADEAENAFTSFLSNVEGMQSAYESLNKAVEEYNKNGVISASTLKKLAKLNPEYVAQLEVVNGKMQLGNGLLQEEFEYQKQLAINSVLVAKQLRVQAICQQYVNDKTNESKTASEKTSPQIQALAESFSTLALESRKAGTAVQYTYASIAGDEAKKDELQQQLDDVDAWADGMIESIQAVNLGAVESSKKSAGQSKDAWVEAFKEEQRQLKHLLEIDEITEYEYYERLKDLNEKYFGEISGKHQKYIKEYQENEEEIYKGIKAVYDKVKDYLAKSIEQGYEKAINALKKEEKRVLDEIKQQLEALKKERDKVLKGIKKQIDALKREKEKVQKYWDDQIDAIKRENEVLQKQNELIEYQQALQRAKSQKVMVLQDGKFQLSENESAVAEAEHNLAEYQDQLSYEQQIQQMEDLRDAQIDTLEDRIQALEDYYDYMEEYYDNQIDAMEEYQKQVERQYEQQIDALQEQLDTFKEGYQKTEDLENAKLATAVLTANQEAKVWEVRLDNLSQFIDAYNKLMGQLNIQDGVFNPNTLYNPTTASFTPSTSIGGVDSNIKTRSSGDAYFANDEIALVGESPNTELVLGSKVNTGGGKFLHLSKGSGVVNAESTRTLAGILNGINNVPVTNNSRSVQQSFNFGTISLPNVTNAESFVDTLSTRFNNYSIQYSNTR